MPKNILVVNDIAGIGKVAGNVNIPILNAARFETFILPTVILSSVTGGFYNDIAIQRLDEQFNQSLSQWDSIDFDFHSYLTGYFGTPQQVAMFTEFVKKHPAPLYVDPIMGDFGVFYDGFDENIANAFSELMGHATMAFPNLTEAYLLTGLPYKNKPTLDELDAIADLLLETGVQTLAITGIEFDDPNEIGFYVKQQHDKKGQYIAHKKFQTDYFGTGDLLVSLMAAYHQHTGDVFATFDAVIPYLIAAIEQTKALKRELRFGLYFEPLLINISNDFKPQ